MGIIDTLKQKQNLITGTGATLDIISDAETKLNLSFAHDYKDYLSNFGLAGYGYHELTGLGVMQRLNVVTVTNYYRDILVDIPNDMYVIENLDIDGITIWQNSEGTIFQVLLDGSVRKIFDNLMQYVECE